MAKFLRSVVVVFLFASGLVFSTSANAEIREWTFLVFMNSDNNLYRFGQMNFAEMERVGSTPQVAVVVQQDPEPYGEPTVRYLIQKNPNSQPGEITSPALQKLGETDMGDWKTLADFMIWGAKAYPAKHYALVMWNHGAGWVGISADDTPRHIMKIPELRKALEGFNTFLKQNTGDASAKLDLINFDACLMSGLEVAYELKDQAKVMVGSQFLEPGEGENYTALLGPLLAKPAMTPAEFAKVMVYQYSLRYAQSNDDGINYLGLDLQKLQPFVGQFSKVATSLLGVAGDMRQNLLREFVNPGDGGGFDLIRSMKKARDITKAKADVALNIDQLVQMYGYPEDNPFVNRSDTTGASRVFKIERNYPGVVKFRYSFNTQWQAKPLELTGNGKYIAMIPAPGRGAQMQYVVARITRLDSPPLPEASTLVMRDGQDPIVYHDNFPATSPVIADSHNLATKGAHGISLYSLAGMQALTRGHRALSGAILQDYKALQFSTTGAPDWTRFFGL